ncbi:MAG: DUF2807 domain-containing protein [Armatimonadota bacterium]
MKGLILLPIGILALGGYVYAGSHLAQGTYAAVKGNGKLKTENRSVPAYTKVVIGSAFEGQFFESTPGPLTISAESNILPLIETKVENETLFVNVKGSVSTRKGFRITGRTAKLAAFEAGGAAKMELKNIGRHALKLEASGASKVSVFGTPSSLDVDASGASEIAFGTLTLESLIVELSGASKLSLAGTTKSANISASGASNFTGNISGEKFKAVASGASKVEIKGHFNTSTTSASGASSISKPY